MNERISYCSTLIGNGLPCHVVMFSWVLQKDRDFQGLVLVDHFLFPTDAQSKQFTEFRHLQKVESSTTRREANFCYHTGNINVSCLKNGFMGL